MTALFVALGIAVITLLALLLWFVPHLLHEQAQRSASESAQLRDMLLDMLNEQEAVTLRQQQLSASISYLQDQLGQMVSASQRTDGQAAAPDQAAVRQLEERIGALQTQIQGWLDTRNNARRSASISESESWANLMGLLAAIQERVGQLSVERTNTAVGMHARALLEELEQEMLQLRGISEDIATLQWRLRRSLHERETNVAQLRSRST